MLINERYQATNPFKKKHFHSNCSIMIFKDSLKPSDRSLASMVTMNGPTPISFSMTYFQPIIEFKAFENTFEISSYQLSASQNMIISSANCRWWIYSSVFCLPASILFLLKTSTDLFSYPSMLKLDTEKKKKKTQCLSNALLNRSI